MNQTKFTKSYVYHFKRIELRHRWAGVFDRCFARKLKVHISLYQKMKPPAALCDYNASMRESQLRTENKRKRTKSNEMDDHGCPG